MSSLLAINPGFVIILAGLICAGLPNSLAGHPIRKVLVVAAPIVAGIMIYLSYQAPGLTVLATGQLEFAGIELTTYRIDSLSMIWAYIFCFAGLVNGIYGLHERARITDSAALIYTGAGLAAVLIGDLISLFVMWELTVVSSVLLVWAGGQRAYWAGMRYLAWHILSGVLLLAGAVMVGRAAGTFGIGELIALHGSGTGIIGTDMPGGWLMLAGIGIKAGFPFLHTWIEDAYPKASITGTVILSAFTTKLAIYALARFYAGMDALIYVGAVMTVFPVFFAVIENDLRRVLAYSLNNQLGFMVCAVGLGTELAINGAAAHVAAHVVYKGLLFMSVGAVMYRVGTAKASELGGLFRTMPLTSLFCLIGAGSIAAFPLLSGFVTKSMILSAALYEERWLALGMLIFASAGVMEHSGIKVPFFSFFAHDSGKRPKEAPVNMLVAMALAALFCIYIALPFGGYQFLYSVLPFPEVKYDPYTGDHVIFQLQLLFAAMFAFAFLKRLHLYPDERRAEILDVDWLYRRVGLGMAKWTDAMWTRLSVQTDRLKTSLFRASGDRLYRLFSPAGTFGTGSPVGMPTVLTAAMLVVTLVIVYLGSRLV